MTKPPAELPSVTVAIPVLNEAENISSVLENILQSEYPNVYEVIIADGGSTDKTREIVESISTEHPKVKLIDNPDRIQSFALNRILDIARGEVFLRLDGHTTYAEDYISACIRTLLETKARNVGGAYRYAAKNPVQAGISLASQSFGFGFSRHKDPNFRGYVDTVPYGCFYTKDLKELGGFSPLQWNEDAELNMRLRKKFSGEAIFISPDIVLWYYPRNNYKALWKQFVNYGIGRAITSRLHDDYAPLRGKLPFLLVSAALIFTILSIVLLNSYSIPLIVLLSLELIVLIESIRNTWKYRGSVFEQIWKGDEDKKPGMISRALHTFLVINTMVLAHFTGYFWQTLRFVFRAEK